MRQLYVYRMSDCRIVGKGQPASDVEAVLSPPYIATMQYQTARVVLCESRRARTSGMRTPTAWGRRERLIALSISALVAVGALAPLLGWPGVPIAIAAAIVVAAAWRSWAAFRKTSIEDALEQAELDRRLRIPISPVRRVDPTRIGVDPASQDILPGGEVPAYLPRDVDRRLDDALAQALDGDGRWMVVLCGPSKVGKSRSLYEALRRRDLKNGDLLLVTPTDGEAVRSLLNPAEARAREVATRAVVWLDDLETYAAEGVGLSFLQEGHRRSSVVFAATYGGKGSERTRELGDADLAVLTDTLLQHANQVSMGATSPHELQRLPADVSRRTLREIERHGLPAVMVAGPSLERKLMTQRHTIGDPEAPEGAAVARAVIDWARCGRTDPIPDETLRKLWPYYLPAGVEAAEDRFASGLEWALRPVSGTISLVQQVKGYLPFDYVVRFVTESDNPPPPQEATWYEAIRSANPRQALGVGIQVDALGVREDLAITVMRTVSESSESEIAGIAAFNLGVLLERRGELEDAEVAFRRADELGDGSGSNNLGTLLKKRGEVAEAEAAFRRAEERGSHAGANNLGVILEQRGDLDGAQELYERADEDGSARGASNLGVLLEESERPEEAMSAYRRASERGFGAGSFNLCLLLESLGDEEGSDAALRRADEQGDVDAAFNLGLKLLDQDELKGAEAAFRRASERGDARGTYNLGVMLKERGETAGAEAAFRLGDEEGDAGCAYNLGFLLWEQDDLEGAEAALRRSDQRGNPEAAAALAEVIAVNGTLDQVEEALRRAMSGGHGGAASNLGVLLAATGSTAEAKEMFLRAEKLGEPDGAFNLGVLYIEQDDPDRARIALERAIASDDHEVAERAEVALERLLEVEDEA